jgi:hypothetical protein
MREEVHDFPSCPDHRLECRQPLDLVASPSAAVLGIGPALPFAYSTRLQAHPKDWPILLSVRY